ASPDRRMTAAALKQSIVLRGKSRQVQPEDFKDFDLILAMDRQNYADLQAMNPDPAYVSKIRLICDYCTEYTDREVPDPYYGGTSGFSYVIDLLQDACHGLLENLKKPKLTQGR
ncbi:MAG: low molecular weight phosphotyrosine protein phosphatase, partial [Acaryochloridaceae cyanobacterium CSU_5_19]|nr:low molecular weight phosphotyrosine protein phosphatase [Acaryochloridaceae cyanobacterium CSU_5_19]